MTSALLLCVSEECVGPCLQASRVLFLRMMPRTWGTQNQNNESRDSWSLVCPQLLLKPSLAQDPEAKGGREEIKRCLGPARNSSVPGLELRERARGMNQKDFKLENARSKLKPDVVAHTHNPNTWEMGAGKSVFKVILHYVEILRPA